MTLVTDALGIHLPTTPPDQQGSDLAISTLIALNIFRNGITEADLRSVLRTDDRAAVSLALDGLLLRERVIFDITRAGTHWKLADTGHFALASVKDVSTLSGHILWGHQ